MASCVKNVLYESVCIVHRSTTIIIRLFFLFFFIFYFYKLLAACCQGYEIGERSDTVEKVDVVEIREDVRETGGGVG